MLNILFQLIAAFIGTISFSVLFSTPNKYLPQCGLIGGYGVGADSYPFNTPSGRFLCGRHFRRKHYFDNLLQISGPLLQGHHHPFSDFRNFHPCSGRRYLLYGLLHHHRSGSDSSLLRHAQLKNSPCHRSRNRCCLFSAAEAFWVEKPKLKYLKKLKAAPHFPYASSNLRISGNGSRLRLKIPWV